MTDAELEEAKRLLSYNPPDTILDHHGSVRTDADTFYAFAILAVPRLIAALESARSERDKLADKLRTSEQQFDALGFINEANVLLAEQRDDARAEAERLSKILNDRMCQECGGAGEECIDRAYGGEHYQDMVQCPACNGDGRTEEGAQKKIAALGDQLNAARAEVEQLRAERDALDQGGIELDVALQIAEWVRTQEDQDGCGEDIAHGILRGDWRTTKGDAGK